PGRWLLRPRPLFQALTRASSLSPAGRAFGLHILAAVSWHSRFWILDFGFWIGFIIQNPKSKIGYNTKVPNLLDPVSYSLNIFALPTLLTMAAVFALGLAVLAYERISRVSLAF